MLCIRIPGTVRPEFHQSARLQGSGEEYVAELRAVFDGEDIDAIIKKHPQPEPISIEETLALLEKRK